MPRSNALRSLAVLFAINILNFYDRQALGAVTEPIRKEFGLSDTQIGLLGTAFTLLYAVVGLPLGRLADNWSRKKLLAGGMVLWSALTASAGLAANYSMLLVSRLGVAVGEAVCAPTATSWLGDLFPPERRSRALAIFMLGVPIGGALSFLVTGPVAEVWGWRFAMAIAAAPALLLAPVLLMLPEPVRGASEGYAASTAKPSPWPVLRIPTLWWIIASGALINFNLYAVATFLPAFLTRYHGLSVGESGFASGIGYGVAGVTGGLVAGVFGDRIVHRRKNGRMVMAALAALVAGPIAFVGIWQPPGSPYASLAWICLSLGFFNMYYGLVYSSIQDIVPPSLRGTTMAVYFLAMYLCGASFGPLITGNLSDRMARRAAEAAGSPAVTEAFKSAGLQQAMYVIPVLAVALALVLYAGSRTIVRDMARRETLT
ncbi:MAG: MFS transporter [Bryobacteraceae bacterium]